MNCPKCGSARNKVVDANKFDTVVKRVRECEKCGIVWKTDEILEDAQPAIPARTLTQVPK